MPTRNISLTAEQDAFVEKLVNAGEYQNASEAVRDKPAAVAPGLASPEALGVPGLSYEWSHRSLCALSSGAETITTDIGSQSAR